MASAGKVMLSPVAGVAPGAATAVRAGAAGVGVRTGVAAAGTGVGVRVAVAAGAAGVAGRAVGDAWAETEPGPVVATARPMIRLSAIMAPPEMSNHLLSLVKRDAIAPPLCS